MMANHWSAFFLSLSEKIQKIRIQRPAYHPVSLIYMCCIAAVYASITGYMAYQHDGFHDSWQSYMIARDHGIQEMIQTAPGEGTPFLWPLVVQFFIWMGFGPSSIKIVAWLSMQTLPWLLRWCGFSAMSIVALLLTPFFVFQFPIIARSYALQAPLLFLAAGSLLHKSWAIHGISLFLLAQCSMFGVIDVVLVMICGFLVDGFRGGKRYIALAIGMVSIIISLSVIYNPQPLPVSFALWPLLAQPICMGLFPFLEVIRFQFGDHGMGFHTYAVRSHTILVSLCFFSTAALCMMAIWKYRLLTIIAIPFFFIFLPGLTAICFIFLHYPAVHVSHDAQLFLVIALIAALFPEMRRCMTPVWMASSLFMVCMLYLSVKKPYEGVDSLLQWTHKQRIHEPIYVFDAYLGVSLRARNAAGFTYSDGRVSGPWDTAADADAIRQHGANIFLRENNTALGDQIISDTEQRPNKIAYMLLFKNHISDETILQSKWIIIGEYQAPSILYGNYPMVLLQRNVDSLSP